MGVTGSGKTTLARRLALRFNVPFLDADDFHPPINIEKMKAGVPLADEDRAPWLAALAGQLRAHDRGVVLACSALKLAHRDVLRTAAPDVRFLHLRADQTTITGRVARRGRHFMPASLVASQFDLLEEPTAEEAAILDATLPLDTVLRLAVEYLDKDAPG